MLVILEGPDGAGKTSLQKRLARNATDITLHAQQPKESPLVEYVKPLAEYTPWDGVDIYCDRWHLGELIYGPLYRHESAIDPTMQAAIEGFLNSKGAVLVHVTASIDVLRRRIAKRGEDFLKDEHLPHVVNMYRDVVNQSNIWRKLTVDTSYNMADTEVIWQMGRRGERSVAI